MQGSTIAAQAIQLTPLNAVITDERGTSQQSVHYHTNTKPREYTYKQAVRSASNWPRTSQSATVHDTTTTYHDLERSGVRTQRNRQSKLARHLSAAHIQNNSFSAQIRKHQRRTAFFFNCALSHASSKNHDSLRHSSVS